MHQEGERREGPARRRRRTPEVAEARDRGGRRIAAARAAVPRADGRRGDAPDRPLAAVVLRVLPRPPPPRAARGRAPRVGAVHDVRALAARAPAKGRRSRARRSTGIVAVYVRARAGDARARRRGDRRSRASSRRTPPSCRPSSTRPRATSTRRSPPGGSSRSTAYETAKALVWMMERYLTPQPRPRAADAARDGRSTRSPRSGRACSTARAEQDLLRRVARSRCMRRTMLVLLAAAAAFPASAAARRARRSATSTPGRPASPPPGPRSRYVTLTRPRGTMVARVRRDGGQVVRTACVPGRVHGACRRARRLRERAVGRRRRRWC